MPVLSGVDIQWKVIVKSCATMKMEMQVVFEILVHRTEIRSLQCIQRALSEIIHSYLFIPLTQ